MSVLSRRAAAACLVIGPALWLASGVFDRVGTGGGTRVAFLSSWPELVGLTMLAFLGTFFLESLVQRWLGHWTAAADHVGALLTPSFALVVLALPYLPWLGDLVPALDALAGPGRWWVVAVVAGQIVWAAVRLAAHRAGRVAPAPGSLGRAAVVFAASAVLYVACAFRLAPGPIYPGGDEPHYLIVTQSLLTDHDLAIANNHERGDYRAYYPNPLKPDYRVAGLGGAIYSIHPIGVSLLVAPAFWLGGYRGASLFLALLTAWMLAIVWRWGARVTGSDGAATVGWLAVATSAPVVLHGFAIYPECAAGLALAIGITWGGGPETRTRSDRLVCGSALAALPWLGTKFAPMSAVVLAGLALHAWRSRPGPSAVKEVVELAAPYVVSVAAWLAWFWMLYGVPSPTAAYGQAHQMSLGSLEAGFPGLFADQEYGVLAVAPVLALAVGGWWRMRRRPDGAWVAAATAGPLFLLAATTGAFALWWGGSAPPGRELVAALPLLVVPLASLWQSSRTTTVQRAGMEWLVLVGIAISATFVLVHGGLLIANGRDGTSELLEYLEPMRQLVRLAPSFIADRDQLALPLLVAAIWAGLAAAAWMAAGRLSPRSAGTSAIAASALGTAAMVAAAVIVPLVLGRWLPAATPVESRAEAVALDRFDAVARPWAIEFTPWRIVSPARAIDDLRLAAGPGTRRDPQPIHVLLNARFALPAGTYRVTLTPERGARLAGSVGLQVGRVGPPQITWTADRGLGAPWSATFTLDVDANFVGIRASADVERGVERLDIDPVAITDAGARLATPPVLASARYGSRAVYFHDDNAYVEGGGFWTRGLATSALTVQLPEGTPPGVAVRMRGGPLRTPVRLSTPAWTTRVVLEPGVTSDVLIPARPDQRLLQVSITPEAVFVPAEAGQTGDHRSLGCWVEMAPYP